MKTYMATGAVVLAGAMLMPLWALAADLVQVAPKQAKVLAENDRVRVLHVNFSKGDKIPPHSHPEMVVYVIKGGKIKFTTSDGKSIEVDPKPGTASIRPPVTHSHEHMAGDEAIVVELKK